MFMYELMGLSLFTSGACECHAGQAAAAAGRGVCSLHGDLRQGGVHMFIMSDGG